MMAKIICGTILFLIGSARAGKTAVVSSIKEFRDVLADEFGAGTIMLAAGNSGSDSDSAGNPWKLAADDCPTGSMITIERDVVIMAQDERVVLDVSAAGKVDEPGKGNCRVANILAKKDAKLDVTFRGLDLTGGHMVYYTLAYGTGTAPEEAAAKFSNYGGLVLNGGVNDGSFQKGALGNDVTFDHCNLYNGYAYENGGLYYHAGGGTATFSHCELHHGGTPDEGGGLYFGSRQNGRGAVFKLDHCKLHDISGTAITMYGTGLEICDCELYDNAAIDNESGGAITIWTMFADSYMTISQTSFRRNRAAKGGAIHFGFIEPFDESYKGALHTSFVDVEFDGNIASNGHNIYIADDSLPEYLPMFTMCSSGTDLTAQHGVCYQDGRTRSTDPGDGCNGGGGPTFNGKNKGEMLEGSIFGDPLSPPACDKGALPTCSASSSGSDSSVDLDSSADSDSNSPGNFDSSGDNSDDAAARLNLVKSNSKGPQTPRGSDDTGSESSSDMLTVPKNCDVSASKVNADEGTDLTEKILNVMVENGCVAQKSDVNEGDTATIVGDNGRRLQVSAGEVYTYTDASFVKTDAPPSPPPLPPPSPPPSPPPPLPPLTESP